jgi:hypothetical protein
LLATNVSIIFDFFSFLERCKETLKVYPPAKHFTRFASENSAAGKQNKTKQKRCSRKASN